MVKIKRLGYEFTALLVLVAFLVLAAIVITNNNTFNVLEDVSSTFNISVNVTDTEIGENITQVNITLPENFTFTANTNLTTAANGGAFSNTSTSTPANTTTTLSWTNTTAALVLNVSKQDFVFNATASKPGTYNITITVINATAVNRTNFTVTVNDTTAPESMLYVSPSDAAETNYSIGQILANISVTDNGNVNVVRTYLFNSSHGIVNNTNSTTNPAFVNFTGLSDGVYYVNATANDTSGNQNLTGPGRRLYRVDTVAPNISFISPTPATETNSSITQILVNFTATDTTTYVGTIRVYLFNSSHGLVNNTNTTTTNIAFVNFTGLADGVYYVNATVNDSLGNQNLTGSGRRLFRIDTAAPNISFIVPSNATGSNLSASEILVNFSASDSVSAVNSIRVYLYNSSYSVINNTNTTTTSTAFVNFTGLSDGVYYVNATANDTVGNLNSTWTETRNFTLDTVAPTISLTQSTSSGTSLTLSISISDVTSGIGSSCTSTRGTISGTGTTQTLTNTTLACSTAYSFTVTCQDRAGNPNFKTETFSTDNCGGGSAGGSGGVSLSPPTSWTNTFVASSEEFQGGYSKSLSENNRVRFTIAGENHYIGILDISGDSVEIEVSSTPQRATMKEGESRKFDTNNDGYYDTKVTVTSIESNKATITAQSIYEKVGGQETSPSAGAEEPAAEIGAGESADSTLSKEKTNYTLWVVIAVVILILIYFLAKKGGRKRKKN